jgi:N4-gp56 family major capsid protein
MSGVTTPPFLNAGTGTQTPMAGSDLTAEFKVYYQRTLLENARENQIHQQFGRKYTIPKGGGKSTEWRRAVPYVITPGMLVPLTEGQPGSPLPFSYVAITVSIAQYGAWVKGTDVVTVVSYDPLLDNISEELGDQAGRVLETLTVEALNAGTNVLIAGTVASNWWTLVAASGGITYGTLVAAREILEENHARPVDGGFFAACMHPLIASSLWLDPDFKEAIKLNDEGRRLWDGELTRVLGFVVTVSNMCKKIPKGTAWGGQTNATDDVYSTLVFGKNAFGIVEWASLGMEEIYNPVGSAKAADPLSQIWTMGWKCSFAVRILNESYMLRIMSTANRGELLPERP